MRARLFSCVSFLAVLLVSVAAAAFVLLDPPRRWFPDDVPLTIVVDDGGLADVGDSDGGVGATMGAIESWNSGGVTVVAAVAGPPDVVLGDGLSHMVFSDPLNICKGFCLAATLTGFFDDGQTGVCDALNVVRITDSDVFFNTKGPFADFTSQSEDPGGDGCAGEVYVEAVAAHEAGHVLGLGHSANGSALMASTLSSCHDKSLHADDFAGRDAVYDCVSFASTVPECGDGTCDAGEDSCECALDCGVAPADELGVCADGADNDCDLAADCQDADCTTDPACTDVGENEKGPRCSDGVDNDLDGLTDCGDSDCARNRACR